LLITSIFAAGQAVFAGYGANAFFVTLNEEQTTPSAEEIENGKIHVKCRSAESDSAGQ
jgi:hypothetical protein